MTQKIFRFVVEFFYLIILYEQASMMIVMMKAKLHLRMPAASATVFL